METMKHPTKEQVEEAVKILTGGFYQANDIHNTLTEAYRFIAETKLQYEDDCYGTPQQAANNLLALRIITSTIESATI